MAERVYFAAMMARNEADEAAGYVAFKMVRGAKRGTGTRTIVGPVRATYPEAVEDARDAADAAGFEPDSRSYIYRGIE